MSVVEAKICSWTDVLSDPELQRSMHGTNCARSSEQYDMLVLGEFSISVLCNYQIFHWYFFSEDKCLNSCKHLFAESQTEDCLELNFKYTDYETLAYLSYSSYLCWTSVHETRAQSLLSVRVSTRRVPLAVCLTNKAR